MVVETDSKTVTTPAEFVETYRDALSRFIREELDDPLSAARAAQLLRAKRAGYYWAGKQYGHLKYDSGIGGYDWTPLDLKEQTQRVFANVYNIIYSDGQKFNSLVGQRRLNQKAVADDPEDAAQYQQAKSANVMARHLLQYWKLQRRAPNEIAQVLWTSGAVFGHTDYVVDERKHGVHSEDVHGMEEVASPGQHVCPQCGGRTQEGATACQYCGAPLDAAPLIPGPTMEQAVKMGSIDYAKGMPELKLYSCLEVSVPFDAKWIDDDCEWLDLSISLSKPKAELILQRLQAKKSNEPLQDWDTDENARDAQRILQEIQNPNNQETHFGKDQIIYSQRWLNPKAFDGLPRSARRAASQLFANGCLVHRMGGRAVAAEDQQMAEYWAVCKTGTDAYMASPGLSHHIMGQQDSLNNFWNMADETVMRGIMKHIVDSQILNPETVQGSANIGEYIFTRTAGVDLSKAVASLPTTRLNEALMPVGQAIRDYTREADNIQPALFGGGDPAPTWRQDQQQKSGALQGLQLPFESMQNFVSDCLTNGVRLAGRHGIGSVSVPATGFGEVGQAVDMESIPETGWHIEAVDSAPQTFSEKVTKISGLSQEAPAIAASIGVGHPINAEKMKSFFGVEEFYAPGEYDFEVVTARIQKLLLEPPVMGPGDPMMGIPPAEQSSIPPDPVLDKPHSAVADIVRTWCKSPAGQKAQEDPTKFFRNVWLHCQEQDQAAAMEAMAMAGPAPAAPPNESASPPQ